MATSFGITAKEAALDLLEADSTWFLHVLGNVQDAGDGTISQINTDIPARAVDELTAADFDTYNIGTSSFTAASFAISFGPASSTGETTTMSQSTDVNPITVKASPPATADIAQAYVVTDNAVLLSSTIILTAGELTTEVSLSVADQVYKIPAGSIDVSLL